MRAYNIQVEDSENKKKKRTLNEFDDVDTSFSTFYHPAIPISMASEFDFFRQSALKFQLLCEYSEIFIKYAHESACQLYGT